MIDENNDLFRKPIAESQRSLSVFSHINDPVFRLGGNVLPKNTIFKNMAEQMKIHYLHMQKPQILLIKRAKTSKICLIENISYGGVFNPFYLLQCCCLML